MAFADVDGDGNGDIVTANNDTDDVSILRGNGRGAFGAAIVIPAGDNPTALAVADLTGDGKTDILTGNAAGQDVTLLAGSGAGRFAAPVVVRIGANSIPLAIKVADITGDGRPDILTANQQSDGTEIPMPELAGSISVVRNDGNGRFAEAHQYKVPDGYGRIAGVAVGDITGDGRADLVGTLPIKSRVVVFPANQGGQFAEPFYRAGGAGPNAVTLIDATDDGNLDIITANFESATLSILPSDGAGHIGYDNNFDVGENPHALIATDLNKDGRTDLATADSFSLTVLMQAANGGFAPPVFHPAPGFPGKIAAGDLNRDGNQDLVVANMSFGEIAVLLGDGTGDFAPALRHPVSDTFRGPYTLALGDVNHDGNLDVVTANSAFLDHDDSLSLLLGDGAGSFAAPQILRLTGHATRYDPKDVVLADTDNNGHLDIVTANFAAQRFRSSPATVEAAFQASPFAHTGRSDGSALADVSGDGSLTLIV